MKRFMCCFAALLVACSAQSASAADVIQNQWVRANQDGMVQGRVVVPRSEGISALRDGVVSLVDERGMYVARDVKSDQTGRFELENVKPGVYTLMINGDEAFACCAMHVVSSNVAVQDEFVVAAGAIDYEVVRSAAVRYLPAGSKQSSAVSFDPSVNPMATDRAVSDDWFRVRLSDGGLKGGLSRAGFAEEMAAPKANVLIFRDGVEVARTLTDASGKFFIPNLPTGSYSVLGSGEFGLGVVGFELVDESFTAAKVQPKDASRLVQQPGAASDELVLQVAPLPGAGEVIEERVIDEQIIDLGIVDDGGVLQGGIVGGGPIGGGPAGGGGVGGRGRLRGILPIGLGAAGLAIALADDSDAIITPIEASPATP
ncbi:MAG: carboxypeptidase-like regulatory domain-containing protein [Planctomycetota bacterium]